MADSVFYFRKAFLSVAGSREIHATNVSVTVTNRAGVKQTDAAVGIFDDNALPTYTASWNVAVPTTGGIDYLTRIVTPGQRHVALRFSTADGVLELFGPIQSAAETQPEDPAGHERTLSSDGVVRSWKASGR